MRRLAVVLLAATLSWLAGCDQLGLESASQAAARREAEGKAVGGGCRQAARSIEACYEQNGRADKAAVFAGWREMNDYMRENQLEAMPAPGPAAQSAHTDDGSDAAGRGDVGAATHEPYKGREPESAATPGKAERNGRSDRTGHGGKAGESAGMAADRHAAGAADPAGAADGADAGRSDVERARTRGRLAAKLASAGGDARTD